MTRSVFVGPSLERVSLKEPGLHIRPPIRAGDVEELLTKAPHTTAIMLIDGIFGAGQAISLGELRLATEQGLAVFGATSLGALRAAEGQGAGILSLGGIAAEYVTGMRTNDADVALLHTEDGRALTAPFVNIEHLGRMLVLAGANRTAVADFVHSCRLVHFTRRTFVTVEDLARQNGLTDVARWLDILRQPDLWDRKAMDALAAVEQFMRLTDDDLERLGQGTADLVDLVPGRITLEQEER